VPGNWPVVPAPRVSKVTIFATALLPTISGDGRHSRRSNPYSHERRHFFFSCAFSLPSRRNVASAQTRLGAKKCIRGFCRPIAQFALARRELSDRERIRLAGSGGRNRVGDSNRRKWQHPRRCPRSQLHLGLREPADACGQSRRRNHPSSTIRSEEEFRNRVRSAPRITSMTAMKPARMSSRSGCGYTRHRRRGRNGNPRHATSPVSGNQRRGSVLLVRGEVYDCEDNDENHNDYPHNLQYSPHGRRLYPWNLKAP